MANSPTITKKNKTGDVMNQIDFIKDAFCEYTDLSAIRFGNKVSLVCRENGKHSDLVIEQVGYNFAWTFEGRSGKIDGSEEQTYALTQKVEYFMEFGEW